VPTSNQATHVQTSPSSPAGRRTRLAATTVATVALLGLVALAVHGGFGHRTQSAPGHTYANDAYTLFVIVFALLVPCGVFLYFVHLREQGLGPRRRKPLLQLLRAILIPCLVVGVLYLLHRDHLFLNGSLHLHTNEHPSDLKAAGGPAKVPRRDTAPTFEWGIVWVVLVVAAAATGWLVLRRRRSTRRPLETALDADLVAAIGDALDDLEAEPDARRAVIAAYARMEGVLARHGLNRRPSETPLEYLRRVLVDLGAQGGAVERLTALFEQAKFGAREVDGTMKRSAIDCLRTIRDGIAA
jgi:Domain of unknown function (DUF4129)